MTSPPYVSSSLDSLQEHISDPRLYFRRSHLNTSSTATINKTTTSSYAPTAWPSVAPPAPSAQLEAPLPLLPLLLRRLQQLPPRLPLLLLPPVRAVRVLVPVPGTRRLTFAITGTCARLDRYLQRHSRSPPWFDSDAL